MSNELTPRQQREIEEDDRVLREIRETAFGNAAARAEDESSDGDFAIAAAGEPA